LLGLMTFYGIVVSWNMLMLPMLIVLTTLVSLSVGMWMSALNVRYRDIRYIMPFLIQVWLFASPVIYPLSMVPPKWRVFMMLNPLTGAIEGFRSAVFAKSFDWLALSISAVITLILFISSIYAFRRMEKSFADII
ncbi:MAG: ABC transporter permease, partial [Acidobacteriota bacterium]|nr:ABC transporter permease [Acidobacteriota bacterium]